MNGLDELRRYIEEMGPEKTPNPNYKYKGRKLFSHSEMRVCNPGLADSLDQTIAWMRELPEMDGLRGANHDAGDGTDEIIAFDIRWLVETDIAAPNGDGTVLCRVKTLPHADFLCGGGYGFAPAFRLEISLLAWLNSDTQDRDLHEALLRCHWVNGKAKLRKPDLIAYSATAARYGLQTQRQALAYVHILANPGTKRILGSFGFDPVSGQGLLWAPLSAVEQRQLEDKARNSGRRIHP